MHVFPYSERPGTPAAKMPSVPVDLRKMRAAKLRDAGEAALGRHLKAMAGRETTVLIERDNSGFTPHYAPLCLDDGANAPEGAILSVRVSGHAGGRLTGSPI